jgi:hypothetical protein
MALDPETRRQLVVAAKIVGIGAPIVIGVLVVWSLEGWSEMELLVAEGLFDPVLSVIIAVVLLKEKQQPPPSKLPPPPPRRPPSMYWGPD